MNQNEKYLNYALCREMLETPQVIRDFEVPDIEQYTKDLQDGTDILLTGEGSSRIFPAKRAISQSLMHGEAHRFFTEGATQAQSYPLADWRIFGSSNSGKTKELIRLFSKLKKEGHNQLFGITAARESPLESLSRKTYVLRCGGEQAVAATKSVAEQALFYDALRASFKGETLKGLESLSEKVQEALTLSIPEDIIKAVSAADMVYFAGRNNGVAEELTLKTNEITRKKSDFLEGTYAAHGIEEVMSSRDVLIVVDPFQEEEEKFMDCLQKGVGVTIIAISRRETSFPYTIRIPEAGDYNNYVELAAGWNLLVEIGLHLGIDLDKPVRARKVGNEFTGE